MFSRPAGIMKIPVETVHQRRGAEKNLIEPESEERPLF